MRTDRAEARPLSRPGDEASFHFAIYGDRTAGPDGGLEILRQAVAETNLIAPDMVLNSNAVNPAYISGAMSRLDMPYMINFGNHQFPGHEAW